MRWGYSISSSASRRCNVAAEREATERLRDRTSLLLLRRPGFRCTASFAPVVAQIAAEELGATSVTSQVHKTSGAELYVAELPR